MKSFIIYTLAVIAAVAIGLWVIAMLDLDTISFLVGWSIGTVFTALNIYLRPTKED